MALAIIEIRHQLASTSDTIYWLISPALFLIAFISASAFHAYSFSITTSALHQTIEPQLPTVDIFDFSARHTTTDVII